MCKHSLFFVFFFCSIESVDSYDNEHRLSIHLLSSQLPLSLALSLSVSLTHTGIVLCGCVCLSICLQFIDDANVWLAWASVCSQQALNYVLNAFVAPLMALTPAADLGIPPLPQSSSLTNRTECSGC